MRNERSVEAQRTVESLRSLNRGLVCSCGERLELAPALIGAFDHSGSRGYRGTFSSLRRSLTAPQNRSYLTVEASLAGSGSSSPIPPGDALSVSCPPR